MAELVIAAAGAAIGSSAGWGIAALGLSGGSVGWIAGSMLANAFSPAQKSYGPRLSDTTVASSTYGAPIAYTQGKSRLAGHVIWASNKREIATTTRQGKGGGKSKHTTYTYEVDLLILLTDNEIEGVSRVWSNGKLIWTKDQNATVKERLASDNIIDWRRITVYTGEASQLPDPTYETAVGIGSAPAYRGRGSVFIEGLQLGSSGQIPNLSFEIGLPWQTDGLTMLQADFGSNSLADVSSYNRPPQKVEYQPGEVALVSGELYTRSWGAVDNYMFYNGPYLGRIFNQGWTSEFFIRVVRVSPINYSAFTLGSFDSYGINAISIKLNGFSSGRNELSISSPGYFSWTDTGNDGFIKLSNYVHIAIVVTPDNILSVYVDGIRVVTGQYDSGRPYSTFVHWGAIVMGGRGFQETHVYFKGVRTRREAMYTGASFVPPNGPADWGPP